jgi:hypothetical protein
MLLCLLLALAVPALAAGGSGTGGGTGGGTSGGSRQPLALESSSVADGAADVTITAEIKLTFSKNVVNMTVKDSNLKCFSLTGPNGAAVPIDVLVGDDQVDPNVKQIITVRPKSPLSPGTPYTLAISKNLTSKSGETLAADVTLRFSTAGNTTSSSAPSSPAASAPPSASASAPAAASPPASAAQNSEPVTSPSAAPASTAAAAGMGVILWLICGGLTVLLVFALFIVRAIKKRKEPRE